MLMVAPRASFTLAALVLSTLILGGCSWAPAIGDGGFGVIVKNATSHEVVLTLAGIEGAPPSAYLLGAESSLTVVPPNELARVREVLALDADCREMGILMIGGGVKAWHDLNVLVVLEDGSLGIDDGPQPDAGLAPRTDRCGVQP